MSELVSQNIFIERDAILTNLVLPSSPITTTLNGTTTLVNLSSTAQLFVGSATGYSVVMPNATTIPQGHKYEFYNTSTQTITVKYDDGTTLFILSQKSTCYIYLQSNLTSNGVWISWQIFSDPNIASGILNYNLTSDILFTTTSATFVLVTDFSLTPEAGTYAIWANINMAASTGNAVAQAAIYKGGVGVTDTIRTAKPGSSNTAFFIALQGVIQFNGTETIDARVNTSAGTLSVTNRTLTMIRLGN